MSGTRARTRTDDGEQGPLVIGRYVLLGAIASGGMAKVHYGRLLGSAGFSRVVAIKRLHENFASDPEFVAMFVDEARLASRVRHPNVVQTLDVVTIDREILLVLDYVQGEVLTRLLRTVRDGGNAVPLPIASAIVSGALRGLHAAHEAKDEGGRLLGIVHRDVSPHNIIVGVDGLPRVLDFGVAKAAGRLHSTRDGQLKGKLAYMAPEQIRGEVTRASDVFAAATVLWETLTGRELFAADNEGATLNRLLNEPIPAPSMSRDDIPPALDAVVLRGLERDPSKRFATAEDMARELRRSVPPADHSDVGRWVEEVAREGLETRERQVAELESAANIFLHDISGRLGERDGIDKPRSQSDMTASLSSGDAAPAAVTRPARASGAIIIVGVVMVAMVIAAWVAWNRSGAPHQAAVAASAETVNEPSSVDSVPSVPAMPSFEPIVTRADAAPSRTAPPILPTRGTKPKPSPEASAPPKQKPDCSQPSYRDENGIVRYKMECL